MKWINRAIALAAVLALSAVAAWAQSADCTDEFKTSQYSKWYDNRTEHQDVAYEAAKEYVKVCPADDSPYATAVKNFIKKYEDANAKGKLGADFTEAIKQRNYKDIVRFGNQYVAADPSNSTAYLWIAFAGWNDATLLPDVVPAARKAIELVEGGKPFDPFKSKDLALSSMNEILARASAKTAPADAIAYFIKAAKYDNKNRLIYGELADAYGNEVEKLTNQYQAFVGKPETNESKLLLANLNQEIDRQIDAWARAAAVSTTPAEKKPFMDALTELYKFRNKSEAGLDELVAGILSKPLPDPPKPITELPTASPSPTPGGTSGAPGGAATGSTVGNPAGGNATSTSTAAKPASGTSNTTSNKPAASGTTTVKPTPTPKPKPRRAHRRG